MPVCPASGIAACLKYHADSIMVLRPWNRIQTNWGSATSRMLKLSATESVAASVIKLWLSLCSYLAPCYVPCLCTAEVVSRISSADGLPVPSMAVHTSMVIDTPSTSMTTWMLLPA